MSEDKNVHCVFCNEILDIDGLIGRHDECPKCGHSIHCCKMCKFYDVHAYNECHEPNAERIVDKEIANYCEYFAVGNTNKENINNNKNDLLAAANALFKK